LAVLELSEAGQGHPGLTNVVEVGHLLWNHRREAMDHRAATMDRVG
jgi:hypothetical protein